MKKFESLGTSLSKEQMKKILGGTAELPKECATNSDCGTKDVSCPDGTVHKDVAGVCIENCTCRYSTVCVSA